jgi:hypothetical protein
VPFVVVFFLPQLRLRKLDAARNLDHCHLRRTDVNSSVASKPANSVSLSTTVVLANHAFDERFALRDDSRSGDSSNPRRG